MARILVVDDEQDLCEILQFNLSLQGHEVDVAYSAEEALPRLHAAEYDLVLLDVMMDGMSGFEMAVQMRRDEALSRVPIIFCTAKDTEDDTLRGFGLGADDYIAKPFRISEVQARIAAVLRRTGSAEVSVSAPKPSADDNGTKSVLTFQDLKLDMVEKRVYIGAQEVVLTRKEYDILMLLLSNAGHLFSREDILDKVWPNDVYVLVRSVDVSIARLRKKLGPEYARYIVSRSGYGYVFQS